MAASFLRRNSIKRRWMTPIQTARERFADVMEKCVSLIHSQDNAAFPGLAPPVGGALPAVTVQMQNNPVHGDFFTPIAHNIVNQASAGVPRPDAQSFAEALAQMARVEIAADPELRTRLEISAHKGFINARITDPEWLKSLRPSTEQRAVAACEPQPQFTFQSVGAVDSCFPEKHGTPRQGSKCPTTRARLTLHADLSPHLLDGLSEFSHVWLLFVFHANTESGSEHSHLKSKVHAPRLMGQSIGAFATRTPHRVNPIGLTVCRLDRIEGRTLFLSGVDLIHGTPVLDVKPYHAADSISKFRMPAWVSDVVQVPLLTVSFARRAEEQLVRIVAGESLDHYGAHELAAVRTAISDCLALDPRSVHSKTSHERGIYSLSFDRLDATFRMLSSTHCEVWRISYCPPDIPRERTRTREWLERTTAELEELVKSNQLDEFPAPAPPSPVASADDSARAVAAPAAAAAAAHEPALRHKPPPL
jgi:tRNA-Thr(GGU) m(6)t(6)A37 methyltransferase TsaA